MAQRFTSADMVNGLVLALSQRGYSSFLVRSDRIDAAFESAYRTLVDLAPKFDLDVRFAVVLDDFSESQILRSALNAASQRDVVSFDNPEYEDMRLDGQKVRSTVRFERLPAGEDLYDQLADAFIDAYETFAPEDQLTPLLPS